MQTLQIIILAVFLVSLSAEVCWSQWRGRAVYNGREVLSNVSMAVVNAWIKPLTIAWSLLLMSLVEPMQLWRLPDGMAAFALTFVVTDLAFYAYHRISHTWAVLWTLHATHHSSPWMNLTTAIRLNWVAKFVSPVFFGR